MNRLTITIWKKHATLALLAATALAVSSCGGGVPDCADGEVLNLAKQIITRDTSEVDASLSTQSILSQQKIRADWTSLRIDNVRFQDENEKTKAKRCAARSLVDIESGGVKQVVGRDISYLIERTEKNGEFYVTVENTSAPAIVQDATALSVTPSTAATSIKRSSVDWRSFEHQNHYLFLSDPKVKQVLAAQVVGSYDDLVLDSNIELEELAMVDQHFLLGSYCLQAACDEYRVFFVVDTQTEKFFAALRTPSRDEVVAGKDFVPQGVVLETYTNWLTGGPR